MAEIASPAAVISLEHLILPPAAKATTLLQLPLSVRRSRLFDGLKPKAAHFAGFSLDSGIWKNKTKGGIFKHSRRTVSALISEENAVASSSSANDVFKLTYLEITYLEPGQSSEITGRDGSKVKVKATPGPVLGPPWQRPENGYIVFSPGGKSSLYYEPHCVYDQNLLENERADILITPVIKLFLPYFKLVSGQEDAVQLAKILKAKIVVPMRNGDLDTKGLLANLVKPEGTMNTFKEILSKELPEVEVLEPSPGIPLDVLPSSKLP